MVGSSTILAQCLMSCVGYFLAESLFWLKIFPFAKYCCVRFVMDFFEVLDLVQLAIGSYGSFEFFSLLYPPLEVLPPNFIG